VIAPAFALASGTAKLNARLIKSNINGIAFMTLNFQVGLSSIFGSGVRCVVGFFVKTSGFMNTSKWFINVFTHKIKLRFHYIFITEMLS